MPFDSTGKISFDHIYTAPDPRPFYGTLRRVGYEIPQLAKPYFEKLIAEHHAEQPTVLDVGCSYGVNAALRRCDTTMDGLYRHYTDPEVLALDHTRLVEADRARVGGPGGARFYGLDASAPALEYALSAGFLDEAIHADFERHEPDSAQRKLLDDVDLVVSTGCVGYVTEKTLQRIARGSRPWMAHFVLRMFSYQPVADRLAELGYDTAAVGGVFRQRRFASAEEQAQILGTLTAAGVDPAGLESEGWLYARLYVSRPDGAAADLAAALESSEEEGTP
ncbi:class I SAM-dependent methyltransferase [Amycolatopsis sp. PS_44_ISF1]|uniref:class I SAM-dependent methyltransferase n=1 Tax=Amycolatopsis sp. PS_44_ISF1 TaxID=2974917 RepID=UPI0028DE190D|nr:class I SAM-dependent methyltransferase [Amycolatopsis sp. PS_44_ISF1]MDT8912219.1 class I SAM-dependent methyltransferase [Amycolatopsis sp. PS_44_ISF1]